MFNVGDLLLKRYQLQQPLGNTAIGHQTWLAYDLQSPIQPSYNDRKNWLWLLQNIPNIFSSKYYHKVTVKLLAFSPQLQWEQFKLFEREAQVLQSLNHPRIPRYQNYFEIDEQKGDGIAWFALVEDYIPGVSLQDILDKKESLSEQKIQYIANEILSILIYLHGLNPPVLHRDIKPSNLILGEDGQIYLIDFGSVKVENSVSNITVTVVGTSGYTPLEQFLGKAVPASDLYALGATLIHLVTGISPSDLQTQDWQIRFDDQVNIKGYFKQWLKQLIDINLENRYQTAKQALQELYRLKVIPEKESITDALSLPQSTKIKWNKSESGMEIFVPSPPFKLIKQWLRNKTGFSSDLNHNNYLVLFIIIYALLLVPFLLTLTGIMLKTSSFIVASLEIMGGISCFLFLALSLIIIISTLSSKTHLFLTENTLNIGEKILTIETNKSKENYHNIVGVFIHEFFEQYQVSINTRNRIYYLGNQLNKEEALWLAKEIQNWL
ncbi:serine/threonine protein kinase [Aphanothece sacrum]|uniref:Serine/threonine protein kinase n=1 Tax=Aphanothece sacrum FPU1 TaxID=1920663 RepID=A0A401ICZ1_APHSA|nr:serine/threonine-protein kinase [Aphanothece sacrum]GBF79104.1 serine/threonine protein kinase [Aphanothece sacrum FPU1]GBF85151.1 serine/threonine protein kinase [Aphanothece sacrum FPU3]